MFNFCTVVLGYFAIPLLTGESLLYYSDSRADGYGGTLEFDFYGVALLHRSHFTLTDIKYISIKSNPGSNAIKWIQYSVFIWGIGLESYI